MVEWKFAQLHDLKKNPAALLVVPLFVEDKMPKEYRIAAGDFDGKIARTTLIYADESISGAPRILLLGLGKKKECSLVALRHAVGAATIAVQARKLTSYALVMPAYVLQKFNTMALGEFLGRGIGVGSYSFDVYKTVPEAKVAPVTEVTLVDVPGTKRPRLQKGLENGSAIAHCINHVRDLGNTPPHEMTPSTLAREAQKVTSRHSKKVACRVLDREDMKKEGMGALLGVAQGSVEPPKFIILEYTNAPKSTAPIVLVGKGITFDSGGISIKPADKMDEMKFDMLGGATVIGAICAAEMLQLRLNIVGLIPATENLPGGSAYRPGDILKSHNGKTIEVLNTDAEGRLLLADALSYATRYKPRYCIDLATLTGACVVALGSERSGLFTQDEKLAQMINEAAEYTGDRVWRMPIGEEYTELIKSDIADVKNIGGRDAGASTAASFLAEFVTYPWAHIDIAGTAWNMKSKPWIRAGATGQGVHMLIEFLRQL